MTDTKDSRICPKCQMPYEKTGSGSLTQWILVCTCNLKDDDSNPAIEPLNICSTCGKRVESGRAGTLTQWIFRADLCSCAMPAFVNSAEFGATRSLSGKATVDELESMDELTVETNSFPVDRYAPFRLLGKGAAGSVYLCKDRLLKKRVAVKVLNDLSSELLVAFQKEAKATSQMSHSNIVKVLDFGVTDGHSPYMVLDFINGINLDQLIQQDGPLTLEDALPVFEQLCDALTYAHKRGLMHRDLKPSNILIVPATSTTPATVHLIDFGVGAFKKELLDPRDSQSKTVVGTPAYMSPDQAAGKTYDARSEIYSFGCVIFETLTGQVPFVADTPLAAIAMHAHQPPPALSDVLQSRAFPEQIESIVSICLNKKPEDRFQSVDELKKEFSELRSSISSQDRHNKSLLNVAPSAKSNSIPVFVVLGVILLTVTVALIYYQFSPISEDAAPVKTVSRELEDGYAAMDQRKWLKIGGHGATKGFSSGPAITDEDFKEIANESGTNTITINITYTVTGSGFKYLSHLPIRAINIQSSALNDEGLAAISSIKSLEWLSLSIGSEITAKGVESLVKLPNLKEFEMLVCVLAPGTIDAVAQMHQLRGFSLYDSKNVTASDIAKLVKGNPQLIFLDLSNTDVQEDVVPIVAEIKTLREFRGLRLPITDKYLDKIAKMPDLTSLLLSETPITDRGLLMLAKSHSLKKIEIAGCRKLTAEGILAFKKAKPKVRLLETAHEERMRKAITK